MGILLMVTNAGVKGVMSWGICASLIGCGKWWSRGEEMVVRVGGRMQRWYDEELLSGTEARYQQISW